MSLIRFCSVATISALAAFPVYADDPDHFHGLKSNTLEESVSNISVYNNKLEELLTGELSPTAMGQIHQLTYTLENALAKLESSIEEIEETLEKVHKGSERADMAIVKSEGKKYLTDSRKIIK